MGLLGIKILAFFCTKFTPTAVYLQSLMDVKKEAQFVSVNYLSFIIYFI